MADAERGRFSVPDGDGDLLTKGDWMELYDDLLAMRAKWKSRARMRREMASRKCPIHPMQTIDSADQCWICGPDVVHSPPSLDRSKTP